MNVLECRGLKKSFGELEVLKDINFEVEKGKVVAILGPSGSGKSTLLRCMTLLETLDDGDMAYSDMTVCQSKDGKASYVSKKDLREVKKKFSLVFQNFNLFPHYSVLKNVVDAPVSVLRRNKKEVTREAEELLAKVGLSEKLDAYPSQLSGGQQQRVAIARALAMKPEIIFFDEPTSALDPEITAGILRLLKELASQKMTMVIVTHEIDFARSVADEVYFMDGGLVIEKGSPEEVIDNPKNDRTRTFLKKLEK